MPLYFQSAKEASPLRSGLLLLPLILTEAFTGVAGGIYIHQVGRYIELIWVGVILLTIGNGLYIHLDATSSIGIIAAFEIISGLGVGLLVSLLFFPISQTQRSPSANSMPQVRPPLHRHPSPHSPILHRHLHRHPRPNPQHRRLPLHRPRRRHIPKRPLPPILHPPLRRPLRTTRGTTLRPRRRHEY